MLIQLDAREGLWSPSFENFNDSSAVKVFSWRFCVTYMRKGPLRKLVVSLRSSALLPLPGGEKGKENGASLEKTRRRTHAAWRIATSIPEARHRLPKRPRTCRQLRLFGFLLSKSLLSKSVLLSLMSLLLIFWVTHFVTSKTHWARTCWSQSISKPHATVSPNLFASPGISDLCFTRKWNTFFFFKVSILRLIFNHFWSQLSSSQPTSQLGSVSARHLRYLAEFQPRKNFVPKNVELVLYRLTCGKTVT